MSAPLFVRNGLVVNSSSSVRADVLLRDGRVEAVCRPGSQPSPPGAVELDAAGKFVMPGGVDPHCHVGFTSGRYTSLDDYRQATTAAVFGGTTTVIDFAIPRPGQQPLAVAQVQKDKAAQGLCDSALHACVVDWDESVPGQLHELAAMGIRTVKMFTTYRGETMAADETIFKVMRDLKDLGGMAVVHCETNYIIEEQQQRCAAYGKISAPHHADSRPEIAETASVASIIAMAESLGAPVYLVHQSSPQSLRLAAEARRRGVTVFSEAVTHHLVLDESCYDGPFPEHFVCCPPLRSAAVVEQMAHAVFDGSVTTIGSDHCCYNTEQKMELKDDVRIMPNGLPGVELRLPVIFSEFVARRGLSPERFVELCCANPARANGLWPRKGSIQPGADADLVIWDPAARTTVRSADLHMATDYTPYEGRELVGWPSTVVVGGTVIVANGLLQQRDAYGSRFARRAD